MRERLTLYYHLTKPGIVYGNALSAIAGFLLAAGTNFDLWLFLAMLAGASLIMASACVFNNYIDQGIDKKMSRTKKRALVEGTISGRHALVYATILGMLGFGLLVFFTNTATVITGAVGFIFYLVIYGIAKRRSTLSTIIGSVSGSTPIVAGYVAVTGQFDTGAALLFLAMAFWQMPHFYAIAMYRSADYAAAGLPVLPVKKGSRLTKINMVAYIVAYAATLAALTLAGYTDFVFLGVMTLLCLYWLRLGILGFSAPDEIAWAKRLFGFSLIVLLGFCALLSLEVVLP